MGKYSVGWMSFDMHSNLIIPFYNEHEKDIDIERLVTAFDHLQFLSNKFQPVTD